MTVVIPDRASDSRAFRGIDDRTLGILLDSVEKPGRYIGGELHRAKKDPRAVAGGVRVCLAFPDSYEIGMSHLGLRILYACLNRVEWVFAERAYCPFPDMEREMRARGIPAFSMETRTPLRDFHVLGFSLQSELSHTNVLTMLDLAGIPLQRRERGERDPIVLAGGPVAFNPEPTSDFFDAYLVGDGEEALCELLDLERRLRKEGTPRARRLAALARSVEGVYVPALYRTRVDRATGAIHVAPSGDAPYPVRKALLEDLDPHPFPTDLLVPQADIVHDRVAVEIARGCTEGCRFCQAGILYRPVRERSPESIVDSIVRGIDRTGFEEASLTALSTADYSCVTPLARAVMARLRVRRTALSVSSLRVYGLTEELAREIAKVRKTGFTIAPEAGTQRMRDAINKGITDDDIDKAAGIAFSKGWTRLKLYFMIGLPTETDEDVAGIAETALRVHRIGKGIGARGLKVVVSVSCHVPKPHSTFQWVPFDPPGELRRKQRLLEERLGRRPGIDLKCHDPRLSSLEACFSRGDRSLGRVIETAWRKGARFDEWTERFRVEIWDDAFRECGIDPGRFHGALPTEGELVWDHIDTRVRKEWLLGDLRNGLRSRFTHPCEKPYLPRTQDPPKTREGITKLVCYDCGVGCDLRAIALERDAARASAESLAAGGPGEPAEAGPAPPAVRPFEPTPGPLFRFRVRYARGGLSRYLSHLETVRLIQRAGRRAGWPVAYSGGYHPHPKLSFGPPPPVGTAGKGEYFDVELTEDLDPGDLRDRLNRHLHEGFRVARVKGIAAKARAIDALVERIEYRVWLEGDAFRRAFGSGEGFRSLLRSRLEGEGWPVGRMVKGRMRVVDAARHLAQWSLRAVGSKGGGDEGFEWRLSLDAVDGRSVRPRELLEGLAGGWLEGTVITRTRLGRLVEGRFVEPIEVEGR